MKAFRIALTQVERPVLRTLETAGAGTAGAGGYIDVMSVPEARHAIFLNGPIGAGKTTLGRALAHELRASFLDSDDLGDPDKPWFAQVKTTSATLVRLGLCALDERPLLVVAKPLRQRDWGYFHSRFAAYDVRTWCITLSATLDGILHPGRGRTFDDHERARIAVMLGEGYASRSFSDLVIATDREELATTLARLAAECRRLLQRG